MPNETETRNQADTFRIGLTMAGAISAGAYSGGVFDFLMEALDAWERAKAKNLDVPRHKVVVNVMSGASAGAMTGAMGVVALADAKPIKRNENNRNKPYLPRLHNAWVVRPKFVDEKGKSDLLGTEDLASGEPVTSMLDTTLLDKILKETLSGIRKIPSKKSRPYISENLHIFMALSNLRGVPYNIEFTMKIKGQPGYPMQNHADRVHFNITGLGDDAGFDSPWAKDDGPKIDLDIETLKTFSPGNPGLWGLFGQAALGSGAFPVGLSPRAIEGVVADDYDNQKWPIKELDGQHFKMKAKFPEDIVGDDRVDYVAVDGGSINNEPFELARWSLMTAPPTPNKNDPVECSRAVIMIDPFPEPYPFKIADTLDRSLIKTIKSIIPMFQHQARFKPWELANALRKDVFSRYLVAPRRYNKRNVLEEHGIACGHLGGFGGFLSEAFRRHDYQLGRYNCYWFLKNHFALPLEISGESNNILTSGYGSCQNKHKHESNIERGRFQILPIIDYVIQDFDYIIIAPEVPDWPRVTRNEVETMIERAKERVNAVFKALLAEQVGSRFFRGVLRLAWKLFGTGKAEEFIRWTVLLDLINRDQLIDSSFNDDGTGDPDKKALRKVLAALANPKYDFRTSKRIAEEFSLSPETVSEILNDENNEDWIAKGRKDTYTLQERKPSWFSQLWGIRHIDEGIFSGKPVID